MDTLFHKSAAFPGGCNWVQLGAIRITPGEKHPKYAHNTRVYGGYLLAIHHIYGIDTKTNTS